MDELITTKEAAELLGIKYQSLRVRNVRGKGPFPFKRARCIGDKNLFRKSEVVKFLVDRDK
jgi:CO/xanthine dehydrogenase Mo-binding subunit